MILNSNPLKIPRKELMEMRKQLAKEAYELDGITYINMRGDIFINGELVATYEGIIN